MSEEAASVIEGLKKADRKKSTTTQSGELSRIVVEAVLAKKGLDIVIIDMSSVSDIADYFVVCTGESDLQIKAIVDGVLSEVKEATGERPYRTEGYDTRNWVLVDFVDVVVHVFDRERREFYNLERLWADAPIERIEDEAAGNSKA